MLAGKTSRKVDSIQALRGCAALLVVVSHAFEHGVEPSPKLFGLIAQLGVDIFFVISGFVIVLATPDGPFDFRNFSFRRIWRVAPLYWVLTLCVAGLTFMASNLFKTTRLDFGHLISSLLFIPMPAPGTDDWRPLFKPGWTLNYEMFFFAAFALTWWCKSRLGRVSMLATVMGAMAVVSLSTDFYKGTFVGFYVNGNLAPFVAGMVFAVVWLRYRDASTRHHPLIVIALTALWFAVTARYLLIAVIPTGRLFGFLLLLASAISTVVLATKFERLANRSTIAQRLGDISYSLYLVHMFIVGAGWAVLHKLGFAQASGVTIVGVMLMVLGSIIAAWISWRYFEDPIQRLGAQWFKKADTTPPVVRLHANAKA
jgi:peptidoglycan/LPS O-acetylase OafA/YrhL